MAHSEKARTISFRVTDLLFLVFLITVPNGTVECAIKALGFISEEECSLVWKSHRYQQSKQKEGALARDKLGQD